MYKLKTILMSIALIVLAGCSNMSTITAVQPGATVTVASLKGDTVPRSDSIRTRTFGNYEFKAVAPGYEPFYGILPLKFDGGALAMDILLFAPATFFNLRKAYSFYEFDLEKKVVRYKFKPEAEWEIFVPNEADAADGKMVMDAKP